MNYYAGDYSKEGSGLTNTVPAAIEQESRDLFSGNISSVATYHAFSKTTANTAADYRAEVYRYDWLNRLKTSKSAMGDDLHSLVLSNQYATSYTYDANGNIMNLTRNAHSRGGGVNMDNLVYKYATSAQGHKLNNRLLAVTDTDDAAEDFGDWKAAGTTADMVYDKRGRLIRNLHEGIQSIEWTAYNKVKKVVPAAGSGKPTVSYRYDAMGNRISKTEALAGVMNRTTSYAYDAAGVLMAVYEDSVLQENVVYGSGRLGTYRPDNGIFFELTNHLGSVQAVVTDKLKPNGEADIVSLHDYYPGGMDMPGRKFIGSAYGFGYQGSLKAGELGANQYTTYFRELDARILRWWSPDPVYQPWQSPYCVMDGNPVALVDPMGAQSEGGEGVEGVDYKDYTTGERVYAPKPAVTQPSSTSGGSKTTSNFAAEFAASQCAYMTNLLSQNVGQKQQMNSFPRYQLLGVTTQQEGDFNVTTAGMSAGESNNGNDFNYRNFDYAAWANAMVTSFEIAGTSFSTYAGMRYTN